MNNLDFSNNKFEELEPLIRDSLSGLRLFKVENNKLEFQSFENNIDLLEEDFFTFSPQDSVGEAIDIKIAEGENIHHPFSCSGTNNIYKWFHNGIAIGIASGNGDFNLNDLSTEDFGEYVCEITNPLVDQLKLYSRPVSVLRYIKLNVSTNVIQLGKEAGSSSVIEITSNTNWSVVSNQAWLKISKNTGILNDSIVFTAEANPTISARTATVVVSATGVSSQTITIIQAAGLNVGANHYDLTTIELYPNPAEVYFSIKGIEKNSLLSIFNLDGILMVSKRVLPDENIQLSGFNEGIYFVKIKTQGETVIRKLIKK